MSFSHTASDHDDLHSIELENIHPNSAVMDATSLVAMQKALLEELSTVLLILEKYQPWTSRDIATRGGIVTLWILTALSGLLIIGGLTALCYGIFEPAAASKFPINFIQSGLIALGVGTGCSIIFSISAEKLTRSLNSRRQLIDLRLNQTERQQLTQLIADLNCFYERQMQAYQNDTVVSIKSMIDLLNHATIKETSDLLAKIRTHLSDTNAWQFFSTYSRPLLEVPEESTDTYEDRHRIALDSSDEEQDDIIYDNDFDIERQHP